jgi:hypothetical protein
VNCFTLNGNLDLVCLGPVMAERKGKCGKSNRQVETNSISIMNFLVNTIRVQKLERSVGHGTHLVNNAHSSWG